MVLKRWQIVAGIALLVTSSVVSALSLGRVRGTALLGRSLDLSIQSTIEPGEALPEASCYLRKCSMAIRVFHQARSASLQNGSALAKCACAFGLPRWLMSLW